MIEFKDEFGDWIMRLENGKILFNRENWPESPPVEFAQAVIILLEKSVIKMDNWKVYEEGLKRKEMDD